jgi:mono/diheme cytochrome c family protein
MRYRSIFCAALCTIGGLAIGQESSTNPEPARPTLEALKAKGAEQSAYRGKLPPDADAHRDSRLTVPEANLADFRQHVLPILAKACVDCHGPDAQEGNIRIDTLDPDLLHGQDVNWWLEVMAVLSNGEMPPPDADELKDEDRSRVVEWLSSEIQLASTFRRASGQHSSFRRLTRYEYNYAMQDILGLPWDFAKDLPPEAHSEDGFQNSSETLHMSVTQLETYRELARKALRRATVSGGRLSAPPPVTHWGITMEQAADREWSGRSEQLDKVKEQFKDDPEKQQQELERLIASFKQPYPRPYYRELSTGDTVRAEWSYGGAKYAFSPSEDEPHLPETFDHIAVIPHGHNQHLTIELGDQVPEEGILRVRIRASRASTDEQHTPSLRLEFGFQASNEGQAVVRVSDADTPVTANPDNPRVYQWDVPLGEIYPRNAFRNVSKMGDLPSPSEYIRFVNTSSPQGGHGDIQIDYVEVTAPVYDHWPPQSHTNIFFDSEHKNNEAVYAREILTSFMSKAWRRNVSRADIELKAKLFDSMRPHCDTFEDAMVEVLATVLSSPNFLYIVSESSPVNSRLASHDLATRLAMFLWCSIPDQQLLDLATSGKLDDPTILTQQVDRMLADPRSGRFAKHFVHQWLDMQLLDFLAIEGKADPLLKEAMQYEPIAFFQEVLHSNASVLDFIHADYAIANERLALHSGLTHVRGNHFRRVQLDAPQNRGGLLTQAGLLAMNSIGDDSHPLKRGVWMLESLLNDPPPPPPPAVPEIDLADPEIAKMTLKERIEDHRNHAACASCHAKIDPWGIAFENYDALGQWRTQVNGKPVDATSRLFNKQELNGMDGLKRFLLEHRQDQFVRALVHKLATYALGRPMTFSDHARIDNVTADVRNQGDGLGTIIHTLVASELFQSR